MAKNEPVSVTMRVRIGENELEVTGPSNYVEKKITEFLERQKSLPAVSTPKDSTQHTAQISPTSTTKGISAAQFFREVAPESDIDRILAAGYYLEKFKNEEKFTAAEVAQTIRHDAKTPPPKNPNEAVNKNIRKGYMMAAGDKDGRMAFVLTTDGEEAIEILRNA